MKLIDIALKDLRRAFRSHFALAFMFVVPILVTALFALMFGGIGGEEEEAFTLPQTAVQIVNLDAGNLDAFPAGTTDLGDFDSMGDLLLNLLQGDAFADLIAVEEAADEAAARAAVDAGEAGVALIIPATFTEALSQPEAVAALELYRDPTLTLGPALVEALVSQMVEQMSARKLGAEVAIGQLAAAGVTPDQALLAEVVGAFGEGAGPAGELRLVAPAGIAEEEDVDVLGQILGMIMGGMSVFFAFFTGASSMETLLTEEEQGTLPRLFTTPTPPLVVLGGRVLASFLMLVVQLVVLFTFGWLAFGIGWGAPLPLLLAGTGIILLSLATGLFVISLLRTTRQSGVVFGGVLTLTGMVGLLPVFTAGSGGNSTVDLASLFVPQGWAMRGLQLSMEGATAAGLLPVLVPTLLWVAILAGVGFYRLSRRFA